MEYRLHTISSRFLRGEDHFPKGQMARKCNSPCCLAVRFSGYLLSLVSNITLAKKLVNDKIIIIIIIIIDKRSYRKIPKISPRVYIFQRPFLRGLFLEGLIFGGAYVRRELAFQNRLG